MDDLPDELIAHIFAHFPETGALTAAMLVCWKWYMYGARLLHCRVVLNLRPGLSIHSSDTVISFMKRLTSPACSTADCIHHLTLCGFASLDIQELILDILGRTRALRSLTMCALNLLQGGMLLPPEIFSSPEFLPNLVALNAASAPFSVSLSHTRRISAIRVHEPMDETLLRRLLSPRSQLAVRIQNLELALSVDSTAAAITRMAYLASALAEAPLHALALQFTLDRPGPVPWTEFEEAVKDMGASLQQLPCLRILSLVIRPDPLIPANADGVGHSQTGEQHRETVTKLLAEKLRVDGGLTYLKRIELRWHGWVVQDGQLVPLPQTALLRLPHKWLLAECDDERY